MTLDLPVHLTPGQARALSRLGHRLLDSILAAGAERGDPAAALASDEARALLSLLGALAQAGQGIGETG